MKYYNKIIEKEMFKILITIFYIIIKNVITKLNKYCIFVWCYMLLKLKEVIEIEKYSLIFLKEYH